MTKDEAIKMAKAKLECLERETSGLWENCNNDCENCDLNYDQGNMGEQKEWLKMMIAALNQGPVYFPPCVDCNTKMNEIREAYDKLKDQAPCEDKLAIERYQDLVDYFGDKDIAKTILGDREEFKRWLDRITWHVRKVDELARKLEQEPCEDAISRQAMLEYQQYLHGKMSNEENHKLWEFIKELPSVTPTRKEWIPVSERLPKEGETVLVCYRTQEGISQSACEWFDMPNRGVVWSTLCGNTPIAWMPLPEPYKEVEK